MKGAEAPGRKVWRAYTGRRVRPALLLLVFLAAPAATEEPDVPAPRNGPWKPLGPPREGDWRWHYPQEKGQTFAAYRAASPVRGAGERDTIYIQPFLTRPPRDGRLLERMETVLEAFFGRPVTVLPNRALPEGSYVLRRRQASVRRMVADLLGSLPEDGLFLLAVTDRDLYVGRLDSVFGWGSLELRVGVMSTARIADGPDEERIRHRTTTLAAHEACHMLSLPHCVFYGCLMNGARTLEESDARPGTLCPVCREKLCWNLGLDPKARYRALAQACDRAELGSLAAEVRGADAVTSSGQKD